MLRNSWGVTLYPQVNLMASIYSISKSNPIDSFDFANSARD